MSERRSTGARPVPETVPVMQRHRVSERERTPWLQNGPEESVSVSSSTYNYLRLARVCVNVCVRNAIPSSTRVPEGVRVW